MTDYTPPTLPLTAEVETLKVLKQLSVAHRYLGELKGIVQTIPNQSILINSLVLQEAKDSSEVENIITTHDEIYKKNVFDNTHEKPATKEVKQYSDALFLGHNLVVENGLLLNSHIKSIQQELEQNDAGFRSQSGTVLKDDQTNEIVYTPPQSLNEIQELMHNLEEYINKDTLCPLDPLIKMAIIHHQFETIHPFFDGNGRTGRIISILYLVAKDLLQIPILYLSRYVVENKSEYYRLLQHVRDTGEWEEWILYMLKAVELVAKQTISVISEIKHLMAEYKEKIRTELPKIYSQDLLNNLFKHPYTKIDFMQKSLGVSRITAAKYLNQLVENGLLLKEKMGKNNYYINTPLVDILTKSIVLGS